MFVNEVDASLPAVSAREIFLLGPTRPYDLLDSGARRSGSITNCPLFSVLANRLTGKGLSKAAHSVCLSAGTFSGQPVLWRAVNSPTGRVRA